MFDESLEQSVASILYHNPSLLDAEIVEVEDFYSNMKIYVSKMIKLRKGNNVINETSIGKSFEIPDDETVSQFEELVMALKTLNKERKLQSLPKAIGKIVTDVNTTEEKLFKIVSAIEKLNVNSYKADDYSVKNQINDYVLELFNDDLLESNIRVGIDAIDKRCSGGFKPGQFIVLAGDPGNFKSTIMYNMALQVAMQGKTVMIFSYEVTRNEIFDIFISYLTDINSVNIEAKIFKDNEAHVAKVNRALEIIEKLPLYIFDNNANLNDIKISAMQKKPDIIFIDYLQIMPSVGVDTTKSLEYITRQLKQISNRTVLDCPIVALSQFSRDKEAETKKLHHLKGSSSIEQNADKVIFTKHILPVNNRDSHKIELTFAKNRQGATGQDIIQVIPEYHKVVG